MFISSTSRLCRQTKPQLELIRRLREYTGSIPRFKKTVETGGSGGALLSRKFRRWLKEEEVPDRVTHEQIQVIQVYKYLLTLKFTYTQHISLVSCKKEITTVAHEKSVMVYFCHWFSL